MTTDIGNSDDYSGAYDSDGFLLDQLLPYFECYVNQSYDTTPTTKISRMFIDLIKKTCKFEVKFDIKKSYDLVQSVKNFNDILK